eukprot:SAG11_NODE_8297_length_1033_cov_0.784797_1_plen_145_part_10
MTIFTSWRLYSRQLGFEINSYSCSTCCDQVAGQCLAVVGEIVPVANPDGYEFSRTVGNRLWRKNRNPNVDTGIAAVGDCIGVDMNRNWGESWHLGDADKQIAGGDGREGSDDPCTYVFRGKAPFSEKESIAVRDLFTDLKSEGYR